MKIEKHIWNSFRKGSRSAFEELYDLYFESLYLYGYRLKTDSGVVKDVIHDVFLELWTKRNKLPEVNHVKAYLMTIVRRKIFNPSENNFLNIEELPLDKELFHESDNEDNEEFELKIQSYLKHLTERQREVIHLRYFEDLSTPEIQKITGLSQQRIYNILSEAIAKLKVIINKYPMIFLVIIYLSNILFH